MGSWTTFWRCNKCKNLNRENDYTCSKCGRSYSDAGYETVYKCNSCGNYEKSSASYCSVCGNS